MSGTTASHSLRVLCNCCEGESSNGSMERRRSSPESLLGGAGPRRENGDSRPRPTAYEP